MCVHQNVFVSKTVLHAFTKIFFVNPAKQLKSEEVTLMLNIGKSNHKEIILFQSAEFNTITELLYLLSSFNKIKSQKTLN